MGASETGLRFQERIVTANTFLISDLAKEYLQKFEALGNAVLNDKRLLDTEKGGIIANVAGNAIAFIHHIDPDLTDVIVEHAKTEAQNLNLKETT